MHVLLNEIGLTRAEAIELAEQILWRDVESLSLIDEEQVRRVLDALEGYSKINWLLRERPRRTSP